MNQLHADTSPIRAGSTTGPAPKAGKTRLKTIAALDGRTVAARRAAALAATFAAELGGELSDVQRMAVQNAAALTAIAEDAQTRRLAGERNVSLDDVVRAASAARRAVRDLGLDAKRAAPATGPTFAEIAAQAQADADERRAQELADADEAYDAEQQSVASELPTAAETPPAEEDEP